MDIKRAGRRARDHPKPRGRGHQNRRRGKWLWFSAGGVGALAAVGLAVFVAIQFSSRRSLPTREHPDLPGIDVAELSDDQFQLLLRESKQTPCVCGCGFTLADCRLKDPTCPSSGPILSDMVKKYMSRQAAQ